ncbi:hypothetical protein NW762_001892 [Fusarium torreyae]|uniref:Uncharacterized protein n=1 Tax=Fusarium torreyae TaxID=1237075 RepID=A0A9W8VLM0_9HYPO|nr:hypothetical protein NW762_001892 [Fusarium torreyae]
MADKKLGSKPEPVPSKKGNASTHDLTPDGASDERNSPAQSLQLSTPTQDQSRPNEGDTTQATSGPENQAVGLSPMERWKKEQLKESYFTPFRCSEAKPLKNTAEKFPLNISEDDEHEPQGPEKHSAHGDKDAKRGSAQRS